MSCPKSAVTTPEPTQRHTATNQNDHGAFRETHGHMANMPASTNATASIQLGARIPAKDSAYDTGKTSVMPISHLQCWRSASFSPGISLWLLARQCRTPLDAVPLNSPAA